MTASETFPSAFFRLFCFWAMSSESCGKKSDDKREPFLLVSFVNIRQLKLDSICRMIMKFALEKVISKWIKWQRNIYFISKCDCCYSENDPNSEGVSQSVEVVEVLGNPVQPLTWHWLWQMGTFNDDSHAQWLCSVYTVQCTQSHFWSFICITKHLWCFWKPLEKYSQLVLPLTAYTRWQLERFQRITLLFNFYFSHNSWALSLFHTIAISIMRSRKLNK